MSTLASIFGKGRAVSAMMTIGERLECRAISVTDISLIKRPEKRSDEVFLEKSRETTKLKSRASLNKLLSGLDLDYNFMKDFYLYVPSH